MTITQEDLLELKRHAPHFHILSAGEPKEAKALFKAAGHAFRRAMRVGAKLAHHAELHKAENVEPHEKQLLEDLARDGSEHDEPLHTKLAEHMQGGGFFKKLWHGIKHVVHKVGNIVGTPFELLNSAATGAKKAARDASHGDFTMANDALSTGERALQLATEAEAAMG
ncbi:uncharacterized protein MONBRDRAFT_8054 [Monosiga brevicollis MX1]|uniref:Uncharacterized protein n=1 Tax=Monosiga brevicollis TaxID=81824 RepID=A9UYX1_MONBE|nr:uncharacterized protein MONBRDRAFT_8054 [Monosiga brevicollis MX1]EDQ89681.1 predicted protein [Monosiga brevicollis MX1]|eukprot:XP_001745710.1 hypothetical protein [Monosiga brevicollis MX1]